MTKENRHNKTAASDAVSISRKLIYGLGSFANNVLGAATGTMTIALNLGLGMDPGKIGLLGAIPRVSDALTDPVMGYISDQTRTRWGRRRPYIFFGSIFCAILFSLLWMLPEKTDTTFFFINLPEIGADGHGRDAFYFWYFLVASILFYVAYTVWVTPWVALGYELTPDYHERTRVMGYASFCGNLSYLVTPWFLWFMQHERFGGEAGIMRGAAWLAFLVGLVVVFCGVLCAIFLKEPFAKGMEKKAAMKAENRTRVSLKESTVDFFRGFGITLRFKPFLKLCAIAFLIFNGFMLIAAFTTYVIIYYVCAGDKVAGGRITGLQGTISGIFAFLLVIIVTKLGTHLGKKRAFIITTAISVVGYLSKWWFFTPAHPMLALVPGVLIAFGFGGLFPLIGSMIADVCDLDELSTHQRREGMFGSIFWWVIKVGMAAALAAGGFMLNATGFDVELPAQSEQTIFWMRLCDVLVPAATSGMAIWILTRYRITEERARAVRAELEARKAEA
ncbi:MAG: MFS transporter [Pontiellaceae bacterium]|nr:MFS transporter [Pontiellaceae bacterium]MBN2785449.1 MFS transporter [Pontiellaceae bacterium]